MSVGKWRSRSPGEALSTGKLNGEVELLPEVGAVLFHSEDPLRLVRFYQEVLGLRPSFAGPDGAEFRVGAVRIGIWSHDRIRGEARDPDRVIVNFLVPDAAAAHDELSRRGAVFVKPPTEEDWGGQRVALATFRDPDGNLLQLLEFRR